VSGHSFLGDGPLASISPDTVTAGVELVSTAGTLASVLVTLSLLEEFAGGQEPEAGFCGDDASRAAMSGSRSGTAAWVNSTSAVAWAVMPRRRKLMGARKRIVAGRVSWQGESRVGGLNLLILASSMRRVSCLE
jgi:hypothetical protein